jgi:hypothetical protein
VVVIWTCVLLVVMKVPNCYLSEERSEVSSPLCTVCEDCLGILSEAPLKVCSGSGDRCAWEETCRVIVPNILKHENPFVTLKHFANLHIIFVPFGFVNWEDTFTFYSSQQQIQVFLILQTYKFSLQWSLLICTCLLLNRLHFQCNRQLQLLWLKQW